MKKQVLLIEDRETTRQMVEETLRRRGYDVRSAGTVQDGLALLQEEAPHLLLTDLQLPDGTGLDLLARGLERDADLPVIVMSAFGTIEIAVDAVKAGAYDFVPKPFDTNRLVELVGHALERRPRASREVDESGILGKSEAIRGVLHAARRVASSDATVLIEGESGTGKELFARAIHRWSGRSKGPLVCVNCAAIPLDLIEAEFFGTEKGAFTGAHARRLGKVESAAGGTLFLDEVGELPATLQPKLLRVLQERSFSRIGSSEEIHADIRVVAATNRNLAQLVREGRFREDLFYRLNVFPIRVPSLDERREDIALLAEHFLDAASERMAGTSLTVSEKALRELESRKWSGNVRELQNVVERAAILAERGHIEFEHVSLSEGSSAPVSEVETVVGEIENLLEVGRKAQRAAESRAIRAALVATGGNKTEAARRLGVSYKTLWSKLKEYEIS